MLSEDYPDMVGWTKLGDDIDITAEVAKLERVASAAKKQRDMLRKTRHFNDLTEIEVEIFEALKEAEGLF